MKVVAKEFLGKVWSLGNLYRFVCTVHLTLNVWFNFSMILAQKKPIKRIVEQTHYVFIRIDFLMEAPLSWPYPLRGRFSLPSHPTCRLVDRQAVSDCQRPAFYHDHHVWYADDRDDGLYSSPPSSDTEYALMRITTWRLWCTRQRWSWR